MPVTRLPAPATKSWANVGMHAVRGLAERRRGRPARRASRGRRGSPRAAISSIRRRVLATCSASPGRNAVPTAYDLGAGRSKPTSRATSRRNASGTWIRMPAPSPELVSAPAAPRWSRLSSAVMPLRTMSWLASPGQRRDERHAARVVLVGGVVEALGRRVGVRVRHRRSPLVFLEAQPSAWSDRRGEGGAALLSVVQGTTLARAERSGYQRGPSRDSFVSAGGTLAAASSRSST